MNHQSPTRHLPIRPVLRFSTPDPRHPYYKDYHMVCGHVLVHRPLRRGSDGRYHVARRLACPLCARLAVQRGSGVGSAAAGATGAGAAGPSRPLMI